MLEEVGAAQVRDDGSHYTILLNVASLRPEELLIKTVDSAVLVEAAEPGPAGQVTNFTTAKKHDKKDPLLTNICNAIHSLKM